MNDLQTFALRKVQEQMGLIGRGYLNDSPLLSTSDGHDWHPNKLKLRVPDLPAHLVLHFAGRTIFLSSDDVLSFIHIHSPFNDLGKIGFHTWSVAPPFLDGGGLIGLNTCSFMASELTREFYVMNCYTLSLLHTNLPI